MESRGNRSVSSSIICSNALEMCLFFQFEAILIFSCFSEVNRIALECSAVESPIKSASYSRTSREQWPLSGFTYGILEVARSIRISSTNQIKHFFGFDSTAR